MEELVTISVDFYDELLASYTILCALEEMGVDNWSGYEEAIKLLEKEEEFND